MPDDRTPPAELVVNPFLHQEVGRLYNPLTDAALGSGEADGQRLTRLRCGSLAVTDLEGDERERLRQGGWLVPRSVEGGRAYRLKYVTLETHTVCNQGCYFCPVAASRRPRHFMPTELFERVLDQVAELRATVDAVATTNYNEPTLDPRFTGQVRAIAERGLAPAVVTNGWGLTPEVVDALVAVGTVRYLVVNLSTLDPERYQLERQAPHLRHVLRNLDQLKDREVAREMKIVVLGQGDEAHQRDFETISARYEGSRLAVERHLVMDRAGHLAQGLHPPDPSLPLAGCENVGSRPLQHIHVTAHGQVVLCCQDYDERYPVGHLDHSSVREVLEGEALARYRRWAYGLEPAPADFICRRCVFALRGAPAADR